MGVDVQVQLFDLDRYRTRVLPAYRAFAERGDVEPLLAQLADVRDRMPEPQPPGTPRPILLNRSELDSEVGALTRREGDLRARVRQFTMPLLVEGCLEWRGDVAPDQSMSAPHVVRHLYASSRWIEELFTGVKRVAGQDLEFSPGSASRVMDREQVERFRAELQRVPSARDPDTEADVESLRAVVARSLDLPGRALLYTLR